MRRLKSSTDHLSTRLLWFGFLSLGVVVLVYCKEPLFGLFLKSSAPSDEIRNLDKMLVLIWRSGSNSTELVVDPSTGLRCQFTGDPDQFNRSDAVIFHGDGMRLEDFPARTRSDQKWIYRTMETPVNVYPPSLKLIRLRQQRHLYNLTSTFLLRSDIPTPYFDGECEYDDSRGADDDDQNERLLTRVIRGKSRTAAWFVTHCTTSSRRERCDSNSRVWFCKLFRKRSTVTWRMYCNNYVDQIMIQAENAIQLYHSISLLQFAI